MKASLRSGARATRSRSALLLGSLRVAIIPRKLQPPKTRARRHKTIASTSPLPLPRPADLDACDDVGDPTPAPSAPPACLLCLPAASVPALAMFAQYSPLFTSGLLSESNTPSTSRRPSLEMRQKDPRESLPVDASLDSIYEPTTSTSEADALFLTIMPSRRREAGNSFLSLDLAESQSLRSMSLRRKDTITTRACVQSIPVKERFPSATAWGLPDSFPVAEVSRCSATQDADGGGVGRVGGQNG